MYKTKIGCFAADKQGCGEARIVRPYSRIEGAVQFNSMEVKDIDDGIETMVLQRQYNGFVFSNMIYSMNNYNTKVIYEIDDDLFTIDKTNVLAYKEFTQDPNKMHNFKMFMQYCTALTCSTDHLKTQLQKVTNRPIFVLKNCIDFKTWDIFYNLHKMNDNKDKVIIGWAGSSSHLGDFNNIIYSLIEILKTNPNVILKFVGENFGMFSEFDDVRSQVIHEPWGVASSFGIKLVDIDIGLIPLEYNTFNLSKSNLKFLEYSSIGIPTVATDIECYKEIEHGVTGFKVKKNRHLNWMKSIQKLIDDKNLRNEIGENAHKYVKENYDIDVYVEEYKKVLEKVLTIDNPPKIGVEISYEKPKDKK